MKQEVVALNQWILEKKVNPKQPLGRMECKKMTGKWIMEYAQVTRYDCFGERAAYHFNSVVTTESPAQYLSCVHKYYILYIPSTTRTIHKSIQIQIVHTSTTRKHHTINDSLIVQHRIIPNGHKGYSAQNTSNKTIELSGLSSGVHLNLSFIIKSR